MDKLEQDDTKHAIVSWNHQLIFMTKKGEAATVIWVDIGLSNLATIRVIHTLINDPAVQFEQQPICSVNYELSLNGMGNFITD